MSTWSEGGKSKGHSIGCQGCSLTCFWLRLLEGAETQNMLLLQRALSLQVCRKGVTEACLREKVKQ